MPLGKPKAPKAPKPPKAPKEKKPKKPKKEKPPKVKKVKKEKNAPEEVEGLEEGQQPKKKRPLILLLIPPVVIAAAAAIIFFTVIKPRLSGDAEPDPSSEPSATVEPQPPELPTSIPIGDDVNIVGLALEADEGGAQAVKSKRVTYTYINLNDAGKAAQTYAGQLAGESPAFSVVNEEFVKQKDAPDYTAAEGTVLLARNAPKKEAPKASAAPETNPPDSTASQGPAAELVLGGKTGFETGFGKPIPTPEPEPEPEPISYVHTVRITWSSGVCVVTADEEEGQVTSPASSGASGQALSIRGAVSRLREMAPVKLGLEGESMEAYELVPMDATEMVNGGACIKIYVYNDANNQFVSSYLLSIDGQHLYRMVDGEAVELEGYP